MPENTCGTSCSACEQPNAVLVRLVEALMRMGVDFELRHLAA
ncbi:MULTISPECIES: hypothetical protein [Mycobacteroides]|nr:MULTISPECIES: hypothetical protein [Mycobacteroides]MDM2349098.1 hypothetical protein [Mycobacteroides abscessus]MDM2359886.1 hypothetical protein [Mycobacteroides abscessus]